MKHIDVIVGYVRKYCEGSLSPAWVHEYGRKHSPTGVLFDLVDL